MGPSPLLSGLIKGLGVMEMLALGPVTEVVVEVPVAPVAVVVEMATAPVAVVEEVAVAPVVVVVAAAAEVMSGLVMLLITSVASTGRGETISEAGKGEALGLSKSGRMTVGPSSVSITAIRV